MPTDTTTQSMPADAGELFNKRLPAVLERNKDEATAINAKFQMIVTDAGSWHIDLTSTGPSITAGEKPADCTVTIAADDFKKLMQNPAAGAQLFFAGKLKISGNQMLGLKLPKLFSLR
jgi:putative sterol carrier protein